MSTIQENDDQRYIRRELSKARPYDAAEKVQLKIRSSAGESRWVSIPSDVYERVIDAACTLPAPKTGPHTGCEGHQDDDATLTSGVGIGETTYCDGSCIPKEK